MPKPDSLQGSLDLMVLKILSRRPQLYGYAIMLADYLSPIRSFGVSIVVACAVLVVVGVVLLGYCILPAYLIRTGVYQNWPDASDPTIFWRLFLGVNAVGIWDELFFICTMFTLLRQHFPDWLANILQAVVFSSFLWEIGYQAWGPLLTFPFALLQGYTFKLTKSLTYVVTVHLTFDFVLFLALVHAHNRDWLPIFLY